jgi:hypothetical protein
VVRRNPLLGTKRKDDVKGKGWRGVDFDGTLVEYHGWKGSGYDQIGEPVWPMVDRVKGWLAEGKNVQIVTARVHPENLGAEESWEAIKRWCIEVLGEELPVRCDKDLFMIELWDDRCVQVITNTGQRADGKG